MRYLLYILLLTLSVEGYSQIGMLLVGGTGAPEELLLDLYPGAAAAYAMNKLDKDYAGSCIRVRRSSDSAEQDIGFSGVDLDESSLTAFCSGTNCFVKTWYDQSGNGKNATQTTAASQPKIYDSSTGVVHENSIAALQFDGSNDRFSVTIPSPLTMGGGSLFWVLSRATTGIFSLNLGDITSSSYPLAWFNNNTMYERFGTSLNIESGQMQTGQLLLSVVRRSSTTGIYVNSGLIDNNANTSLNTSAYAFLGYTGGVYHNGKKQSIILYPSDQSANRAAIETIINDYYSIY